MFALLLVAGFAGEPVADVVWRGRGGELRLRAPEGEHIAEDAPVDLSVDVGGRSVDLRGLGADVVGGVSLGDVRGRSIAGRLSVSLCEDGGTQCRMVSWQVAGTVPDRVRGAMVLEASRGAPLEEPMGFPSRVDAEQVWEATRRRAALSGKLVLLEFGAVWCSPCNQLAADVLHGQPRPVPLGMWEVGTVDVDDPSSWALKDAHHIEGYPTLLALSLDGRELSRLVGYPGRTATLAWLERTAQRARGQVPASLTAADDAWDALRAGREAAARDLMEGVDVRDATARMVRLHLDPGREDALWLATHAVDDAMSWVPAAVAVARDDEEVREALLGVVRGLLARGAEGDAAAELVSALAEVAPAPERSLLFAAAAALVRGELTGDAYRDRGRMLWLAWLVEQSGEVDAAVRLLERQAGLFPDDPTFYTALARLRLRDGRAAAALAAADQAFDVSWGDNRLMAAKVRARALLALGRRDEARAFVRGLLEEPAPPEGVDVRTHALRRELAALVEHPPRDP